MKNKGFSLVELIIVIAIMAILAAAIAPALIRYIDKSRKADDVTAAGTIESSVSAAIANEDAYEEAVKATPTVVANVSKGGGSYIGATFKSEMESSLPQGADIKFKKKGASFYVAQTDANGQISVYLEKSSGTTNNDGTNGWMIRPTCHADYK